MMSDTGPVSRLARANQLREQGEAARRRDGATARRCYEEAVALFREAGEPLALAHAVRHLGDVYREEGCPDLAEPCYLEALRLYRNHPGGPSPNLANAVRSLAVLRWEQSRALWDEARDLYTKFSIEPGIQESSARVAALSVE